MLKPLLAALATISAMAGVVAAAALASRSHNHGSRRPVGSKLLLLGDTHIEATSDGGRGTSESFGYTALTTGTATDIEVYLTSMSGLRVGLYADVAGKPGPRLATGSVSGNARGWVDVRIPRVAIRAGTRYWLAIAARTNKSTITYRDVGASGSNLDYGGSGLLDPYAVNASWQSNPASVYLKGTVQTPTTTTTPTTSTTTTTSSTTTLTTSSTTTGSSATTSGGGGGTEELPHDPTFMGPSYYAKWSNGPSTSMSYFPIFQYQIGCWGCWAGLPSALQDAGINALDNEYDGGGSAAVQVANAANLKMFVNESYASVQSNGSPQDVMGYAMWDEPNGTTAGGYAPGNCQNITAGDTCAQKYVDDANAYRSADPTRPVLGTLGGGEILNDGAFCMPYSSSTGWSAQTCFQHLKTQLRGLDIASADGYYWSSIWNIDQSTATQTDCKPPYGSPCAAWMYGAIQDKLHAAAPDIPSYGFVQSIDGTPPPQGTNDMTPEMIETAVWDMLTHGMRGLVYWTTDFTDSSDDPNDCPVSGATYHGDYAVYADCQWSAQLAEMKHIDSEIQTYTQELNSPTVTGISATSSDGTPVATLGKDLGGKLWLVAMADGNASHNFSNQSAMTATVTVPDSVPVGTVLDVVGENRSVTVDANHQFPDTFGTYTDHPRNCGCTLTYGYRHHIYSQQ